MFANNDRQAVGTYTVRLYLSFAAAERYTTMAAAFGFGDNNDTMEGILLKLEGHRRPYVDNQLEQ